MCVYGTLGARLLPLYPLSGDDFTAFNLANFMISTAASHFGLLIAQSDSG